MIRLRRLNARPILAVSLATAGMVATGCGGASHAKPSGAPAQAASTNPTKAAPPPAELVGQYTTTLKKSDLPADTPVELGGRYGYLMTVRKDGGVDDAPTLGVVIASPRSDAFIRGGLSVSGATLTLTDEACAVEPVGVVNSTYGWKLTGTMLRITTVKDGCTDKVFDSILTSRPWKKQSTTT
jgi:hypothetical protein